MRLVLKTEKGDQYGRTAKLFRADDPDEEPLAGVTKVVCVLTAGGIPIITITISGIEIQFLEGEGRYDLDEEALKAAALAGGFELIPIPDLKEELGNED